MNERRIDAFFYGLFMDIDILREAGVAPVNPRQAYVEDLALRIGPRLWHQFPAAAAVAWLGLSPYADVQRVRAIQRQ